MKDKEQVIGELNGFIKDIDNIKDIVVIRRCENGTCGMMTNDDIMGLRMLLDYAKDILSDNNMHECDICDKTLPLDSMHCMDVNHEVGDLIVCTDCYNLHKGDCPQQGDNSNDNRN